MARPQPVVVCSNIKQSIRFFRFEKGFTLIELVMVMVLLGVLSSVGVSLIPSAQNYQLALAKDQWLNVLRLAQRMSLSRQHPDNPIILTFQSKEDAWLASISQASDMLYETRIDVSRTVLAMSNDAFETQCETLKSPALPLTFIFNGEGELKNEEGITLNHNQRVCLVGKETVFELCIAASGYSYEGRCEA